VKHIHIGIYLIGVFCLLNCGGAQTRSEPDALNATQSSANISSSITNEDTNQELTSNRAMYASTSEPPDITILTSEKFAYEKENIAAKFSVQRDTIGDEISINYILEGNPSFAEGSASSADYRLVYSNGEDVGKKITIPENQNQRTIEVHPEQDGVHEVPETLTVTLQDSSAYNLNSAKKAELVINDAKNSSENAKIFIGVFSPQDKAVTNATGTLSLILNGNNSSALLSYNFFNLGSEQTDQHIHLAPSGTVIHDIEAFGPVNSLEWRLAPSGIFSTKQEMLDALFSGQFYLNIHTANYPAGEISAHLVYDEKISALEEQALTAADVDHDIIRFLTQTTFGPTEKDYQALRSKIKTDGSNRMKVYEAWIDEQIQIEPTLLLQLTDASYTAFKSTWAVTDRRDAFWTNAIFGKDQLRQRMAFALSEILVVGESVESVRNAYRGGAHYWDTLSANAFKSYRNTLGDVARHPIMGAWLSHLHNKKSQPEAGFFPDENFAREIMQLFSFGLVHRKIDGSILLGNDNLPISTYGNDVLQQMARVFTGLSFRATTTEDGERVDNRNFDLSARSNEYQHRWVEPMKFFPEHHDFGEKSLFTDDGSTLYIPESIDHSEKAAEAELDIVLDNIVAHGSTAPYISRLLIQRFVTSNPSSEYIERVARAFGKTGDLEKVIKAILLDVEARSPAVSHSEQFGKVKEPILRLTSLMRLLKANSQLRLDNKENGLNFNFANLYEDDATILRVSDLELGQKALASTTVFNFFSPNFAPSGDLSTNSLVAPEMELMTESRLFSTFNVIDKLLQKGFVRYSAAENSGFSISQLFVKTQYDDLTSVWDAAEGDDSLKAEAVVDFLDFYLNAGQMKLTNSPSRAIIIETVSSAEAKERMNLAVYGLVNSPEAMVQK